MKIKFKDYIKYYKCKFKCYECFLLKYMIELKYNSSQCILTKGYHKQFKVAYSELSKENKNILNNSVIENKLMGEAQ